LRASNQQLRSSEQQLRAANQQLKANEGQLRAEITERKRAEEKRDELLNRQSAIIENAPVWIFLKDAEGRYVAVNQHFLDLLPTSVDKPIGKRDRDIFGKDIADVLEAEDNEVLRKGLRIRRERRVRLRNGRSAYMMISLAPVRDRLDNIIGLVAAAVDITERSRAEEALRESEKRYRYLFDQSPVGIGLVTLDGKVVAANKQMEVITGYFEAELKKINLADTYENPEDRKRLLETIQRYECAVDFPVRKRRKDGTVYEALLNVSRVHLGGQDLFQTICMDITERKRAEEEITKLAKFPSENPNPVLRIAKDCTILYANAASLPVLQTWRCEEGERIPDPCCRRVEEALGSGEVCTFEFECNDGRIFLVALAPVPGGEYVNAYGIDITERKRAEEALRASEKLAAKGQLAAQIAHEINNPLAGIKNSFMLIQDAIPKEHRYYQYLGRISKEIDRISGIVHKMFGLYKPESETARDFLLDETIGEVVALLEPVCRQHEVAIAIDSSDKAAMVTLPEAPLTQVLYNIVKNAIEASLKGGEVRIAEKITGDVLTITVCDEGNGIAEDLRSRIFEPLFTTKRGFGTAGLGLGLSVSKNIVETMGGSVYFESKAGQGTVFSIILPLGGRRKGV